jgi:hypothetical protein
VKLCWVALSQNFAGCWVAGCPSPKISLGAGWLGGPASKFRWVLGGWVAQPQNFAGCWVTGWPRPKISLGAGGLGAPTQHPAAPWAPNWVDFSNTGRDFQFSRTYICVSRRILSCGFSDSKTEIFVSFSSISFRFLTLDRCAASLLIFRWTFI